MTFNQMNLYIIPGEVWELTTGAFAGTTATLGEYIGAMKATSCDSEYIAYQLPPEIPAEIRVRVKSSDLQGRWIRRDNDAHALVK